MSEKLHNNEMTTESLEVSSGFQSLENEAGNFDPEEALRLREQARPKEQEPKEQFLQVLPEEQAERELSPQEAAEEYLSLLDELSKEFSYPRYKDSHKGQHHYAANITTNLGKKYSKNPHYHMCGGGTESGPTDGTMFRIASADKILASEIGWREEGEKNAAAIEESREKIAKLDEDYAKKGWLGKLIGKRKYEKTRLELSNIERSVSWRTQKYNKAIEKELAISYNEEGDYDYNNGDYGKSKNEARNRQFFGLDDPERAAKVERAIALREQYEPAWTKEK